MPKRKWYQFWLWNSNENDETESISEETEFYKLYPLNQCLELFPTEIIGKILGYLSVEDLYDMSRNSEELTPEIHHLIETHPCWVDHFFNQFCFRDGLWYFIKTVDELRDSHIANAQGFHYFYQNFICWNNKFEFCSDSPKGKFEWTLECISYADEQVSKRNSEFTEFLRYHHHDSFTIYSSRVKNQPRLVKFKGCLKTFMLHRYLFENPERTQFLNQIYSRQNDSSTPLIIVPGSFRIVQDLPSTNQFEPKWILPDRNLIFLESSQNRYL